MKRAVSASLVLLVMAQLATAEVKLPKVFTDNLVLQRSQSTAVWGWAGPGEAVTVTLGSATAQTKASDKGDWMVRLDLREIGKDAAAMELVVAGANTITLKNVLVGEVWLASGQSNMAWALSSSNNAPQEIAAADFPQIRFLGVGGSYAEEPKNDIGSNGWYVCSPTTASGTSAVAFFFARHLHQELKTPIGVIISAVGGTRAEAWTSKEGLDQAGEKYTAEWNQWRQDIAAYPEAKVAYDKALAEWEKSVPHPEPANKGAEEGWAKPDFSDADWQTMKLPGAWESQGLKMDGTVWFRKDLEIAADAAGKDHHLIFVCPDDWDITFFDGKQIGTTTPGAGARQNTVRVYKIPAEMVTVGKHVIAVRVFDRYGVGGILGYGNQITLRLTTAKTGVNLNGDWKYRVETELPAIPADKIATLPKAPRSTAANSPSALYNGMIHPLIPYTLTGAIWYQGEANGNAGTEYRTLLPTMIRDWRSRWGQGDFPFIQVQLANLETSADWPTLREAQLIAAQAVPNAGIATAVDIGEARDIHPRNKQDVGKRLALWALKLAYGKDLVYSGPIYERMEIKDGAARIHFKHVGGGLTARDGKLAGFTVAGEDKKFVEAQATIDGDTVVVRSDAAPSPQAVRYGWAANPTMTLYNKEGLPALPFRTDTQ